MAKLLTSAIRAISSSNYGSQPQALPMLNEISADLRNYFEGQNQIMKKKALMGWYKRIPEVTGIVNKVARDLVSRFHFEPVKGVGTNLVKRANRFALTNGYRRIKFSEAIDMLVTGESYKWKGLLTEQKIRDSVEKRVGSNPLLGYKQKQNLIDNFMLHIRQLKQTDEVGVLRGFNEEILEPQKLSYLASSTVENVFGPYSIKGYIQNINMRNPVEYNIDEIIHSTLMDVDGKANGFTPLESLVVQLELLRFMWQNMMSIHKNGGHMDKMFILKNTDVNSPAYKRIRDQLEKYKLVENRHGHMLFTGDVGVEELSQMDKMQFMDMGLLITGILAMQWQVPRSSIPHVVGGTNTKDDTGGNSEKGYWDNIECMQNIIAEIDNSQLWIPHFGVKLVFDKTYVQKDVQEETAKQLMVNNAMSYEQLLKSSRLKLSKEKKLKMLGLSGADVEELTEEDMIFGNPTMSLDKQESRDDVNDSDDKKNIKDRKKDEQQATMTSNMKPTGTGKERKEIEDKEIEKIVGFNTFVQLYNEDKAYHPGKPPRIIKDSNDFFTTFTFKSSDFVYKTILRNSDLEDNRINIMNLSGQIYEV